MREYLKESLFASGAAGKTLIMIGQESFRRRAIKTHPEDRSDRRKQRTHPMFSQGNFLIKCFSLIFIID